MKSIILNDVNSIKIQESNINGPNGTILCFLEKKFISATGIAKQLAKNISKNELTNKLYVKKSLRITGLTILIIVPTKNIILTSPPPNASSRIILLPRIITIYIIENINIPYTSADIK